MLSRVADAIYWMSRYMERADNVARFVVVNLHMMLDMEMGFEAQWMPLVSITGDDEEFLRRYGKATRDNVVRFLTFDDEYDNSIVSCVSRARENARSVREIISSEMWEQLNSFYLFLRAAARSGQGLYSPHEFYSEVRKSTQLFAGITDGTMSRGEGWHFYRLGSVLERADKTSRLLDVKYYILLPTVSHVGTSYDDIQWSAVLRSTSSFEVYRKEYGRIDPNRIAEFLILNRNFPRSIHYCLARAEDSLFTVSGSERGTFHNPAEQLLGQMRAELAYTPVEEIFRVGLHEFIDHVQARINNIHEAIHDSYFALRTFSQGMGMSARQS